MMHADDSLSTIITCGVEGSCMTTKDVEGKVWTLALPQATSTPCFNDYYEEVVLYISSSFLDHHSMHE
jgi:hypothetical protein